ncbi:hypothetical protein D3C72_1790890 [compost metagenome]
MHRGPAGEARPVRQARIRFGNAREARSLFIGAGAKRGEVIADDVLAATHQVFEFQTPLLQCGRSEVHDHHIALGRELLENRPSLFRIQVQGNALTVARDDLPPDRDVAAQRRNSPHGVTAGLFHLDDVGPIFRQQGRRVRRGQESRRVKNADAGKRLSGFLHVKRSV